MCPGVLMCYGTPKTNSTTSTSACLPRHGGPSHYDRQPRSLGHRLPFFQRNKTAQGAWGTTAIRAEMSLAHPGCGVFSRCPSIISKTQEAVCFANHAPDTAAMPFPLSTGDGVAPGAELGVAKGLC
jgi:hypothetical protein